MSDLLSALIPVVEALESLGVTYRIGGSVASSAMGMARTTLDVDLVTNLQMGQVASLVQQLAGLYYADAQMMRDAIRQASCFNLIHLQTMVKVDVFIIKPREYDQVAFRRHQDQSLDPSRASPLFHLSTREDVVLNKLEWFKLGGEVSERQWRDVLGVLRVQRNMDLDYLRRWAANLNLESLLDKALSEAVGSP